MSKKIGIKKNALLARKEEILKELQYYETRIELERSKNVSSSCYEDDESSESEQEICLDIGPSITELKLQHRQLKTCLQATQELSSLNILQSEVNVMAENPIFEREPPVTEDGVCREVMVECRMDLVPFSMSFCVHKSNHLFGPTHYRNLQVVPVKAAHEKELAKSVLFGLTTPSDAVEVLKNYASAHRSRRSTLARLAEKFAGSLFMEPMPEGGYLLKCANLLEVSWTLQNKWSAIAPFHHRMKFDLEYMDEAYIKIIMHTHKQLLDPTVDTDERTLLMAKIIATCLEAQKPTQDLYDSMVSDPESTKQLKERRTTLDQEIEVPNITKKEVMAPPKSLPKKSKPKGKENIVENKNKPVKRPSSNAAVDNAKKSKTDEHIQSQKKDVKTTKKVSKANEQAKDKNNSKSVKEIEKDKNISDEVGNGQNEAKIDSINNKTQQKKGKITKDAKGNDKNVQKSINNLKDNKINKNNAAANKENNETNIEPLKKTYEKEIITESSVKSKTPSRVISESTLNSKSKEKKKNFVNEKANAESNANLKANKINKADANNKEVHNTRETSTESLIKTSKNEANIASNDLNKNNADLLKSNLNSKSKENNKKLVNEKANAESNENMKENKMNKNKVVANNKEAHKTRETSSESLKKTSKIEVSTANNDFNKHDADISKNNLNSKSKDKIKKTVYEKTNSESYVLQGKTKLKKTSSKEQIVHKEPKQNIHIKTTKTDTIKEQTFIKATSDKNNIEIHKEKSNTQATNVSSELKNKNSANIKIKLNNKEAKQDQIINKDRNTDINNINTIKTKKLLKTQKITDEKNIISNSDIKKVINTLRNSGNSNTDLQNNVNVDKKSKNLENLKKTVKDKPEIEKKKEKQQKRITDIKIKSVQDIKDPKTKMDNLRNTLKDIKKHINSDGETIKEKKNSINPMTVVKSKKSIGVISKAKDSSSKDTKIPRKKLSMGAAKLLRISPRRPLPKSLVPDTLKNSIKSAQKPNTNIPRLLKKPAMKPKM